MKNKNSLLSVIKIICGLLCFGEFSLLILITYAYSMQWLGCTMTPNPVLKILCEAGGFMVFFLLCLDIFLCYKAFLSPQNKMWYTPSLVIILAVQIMILWSSSLIS